MLLLVDIVFPTSFFFLKRLPFPYYVFGNLVKVKLTKDACTYFWALYSVLLVCTSVFMSVPYCFVTVGW